MVWKRRSSTLFSVRQCFHIIISLATKTTCGILKEAQKKAVPYTSETKSDKQKKSYVKVGSQVQFREMEIGDVYVFTNVGTEDSGAKDVTDKEFEQCVRKRLHSDDRRVHCIRTNGITRDRHAYRAVR